MYVFDSKPASIIRMTDFSVYRTRQNFGGKKLDEFGKFNPIRQNFLVAFEQLAT